MTTTLSAQARIAYIVEVFVSAGLNAVALHSDDLGYHALVIDGPRGGKYTAKAVYVDNQSGERIREGVRIRWIPPEGGEVRLGIVETPARAAGLILDHQNNLLP